MHDAVKSQKSLYHLNIINICSFGYDYAQCTSPATVEYSAIWVKLDVLVWHGHMVECPRDLIGEEQIRHPEPFNELVA